MATQSPTGLAMLAEVANHKIYRDLAGHSWHDNWTRVTPQVNELESAGWLKVEYWSKQWELTDAGRAALAAQAVS